MRKIIALISAVTLLCGCFVNVVHADMPEFPDSFIIKLFNTEQSADTDGTDNINIITDNTNYFDVTGNMAWNKFPKDFTVYAASSSENKISVTGYSYLNITMYNPSVPICTDETISQLAAIVYMGADEESISEDNSFKYIITPDWVGWKTVSIPISDITGSECAGFGIAKIELSANRYTEECRKWDTSGNSMNIDAVFLSKGDDVVSLKIKECSIENEQEFVESDLGGNRSVQFVFSSEIADLGSAPVTVKLEDSVLEEGYHYELNNRTLSVIFDENLVSYGMYSISVGEDIKDIFGNKLNEPYCIKFYVESPARLFEITDTSIENNAVDVPPELDGENSYIISFNHDIKVENVADGVVIKKNGSSLSNGYELESDNNRLIIAFDDAVDYSTEYEILFTEDFTDAYNNRLTGVRSLFFTTKAAPPETFTVFEGSQTWTNSDVAYMVTENTRLYDRTLRFQINANSNKSVKFDFDTMDCTGFKYLNCWLYSPKVYDSKLNILVYVLEPAGAYFYYGLNVDWEGWKLVSIPYSDFHPNKSALWTKGDYAAFNIGGWDAIWTENAYVQVDKIWFSKEIPSSLAYLGATMPNNAVLSAMDTEIELMFSNELKEIDETDVVVKNRSGDEISDFSLEVYSNIVKIRFDKDLTPNETYTVEVSGDVSDDSGLKLGKSISYTFKTENPDIAVGNPKFFYNDVETEAIPSAGENLTVKCDYKISDLSKSGALIAAQYDSEGKLLEWEVDDFGDEAEGTAVIECDVNRDATCIKAFVVDSIEQMRPLTLNFSVLGNKNQIERKIYSDIVDASAITFEPEIKIDELTVSGKSTDYGYILETVRADNGDVVMINPIYVNNAQEFTEKYRFDDTLLGGEYSISCVSKNASDKKKIFYIDLNTRNLYLAGINNGIGTDTFAEVCIEHPENFGMENCTESQIKGIVSILPEHTPFDSYKSMLNSMTKLSDLLVELNDRNWTTLGEFLKSNSAWIMDDSDEWRYYSTLSNENKNAINKKIVIRMPVSDITTFRSIFKSEVNAYKNSLKANNSQSGSGGGGGGGVKSPTGSKVSIEVPVGNRVSSTQSYRFSDLESVKWAEESIYDLYEKGILSASEDNKFRPNDNVKREEFVKMLILAVKLRTGSGSSGFADAYPGAWYEPYIISAKDNGIVMGYEDGSFGIGQSISRQDMAVFVHRASKLNSDTVELSFTDKNTVSDYAMDAVANMQAFGIINGMEDDSFRPMESCTRAQAAIVISRLIKEIE